MPNDKPVTTYYDKNDRPIFGGDLLRSYHFTGARRKKYYLYHVAVPTERGFDCVPVCHLDPSKISGGGRCWLNEELAAHSEIIHGYGVGYLSFEDRPKRKVQNAA